MLSKKLSHLKAFTMVELLVSIILSALVLAAAYFLFAHFALNMISGTQKSVTVKSLSRFQDVMLADFMRSDSVKLAMDSMICFFPHKRVNYYFATNLTFRKQAGVTDTFSIDIESRYFFFLDRPVINGHINELRLKISQQEHVLEMIATKPLDAATLMLTQKK